MLRAAIGFYESRHPGAPKPRIYDLEALEPRGRWLTEEEVNRLLSGARSRHAYLFIRLMLATAARPEAVLDLRWEEVDFAGGPRPAQPPWPRPDLQAPADGADRRAAVPALQEAFAHRRTDYVIEYGGYPVASIKKAFRKTALRAGFGRGDLTPYVLRHTAATWMAQDGVPLWEIAGYLGHADTRMVERCYAHHHPDFRKRRSARSTAGSPGSSTIRRGCGRRERRPGRRRFRSSFAPVRRKRRSGAGASP